MAKISLFSACTGPSNEGMVRSPEASNQYNEGINTNDNLSDFNPKQEQQLFQ